MDDQSYVETYTDAKTRGNEKSGLEEDDIKRRHAKSKFWIENLEIVC
jgi:hypothetical protein